MPPAMPIAIAPSPPETRKGFRFGLNPLPLNP